MMGVVTALVVAGGLATAAEEPVIVGGNPTECEVAQALGITKPGCPPPPRLVMPAPKPEVSPAPAPLPVLPPDVAPTSAAVQPPPAAVAVSPPPQPPPPPPSPPALVSRPTPASEPPTARHEFKAVFQITFEFGSARLTEEARNILNLVGAALVAPDAAASRFRIVGHTDRTGSDARNVRLSQQRAEAVRDYLLAHFAIAPARLESTGKGARELLNRAQPTAAENRRVEISNLGVNAEKK